MAKHYKGYIGVSMGGKTYRKPKEKGKKVKCKNCLYFKFGHYCDKKKRTAKDYTKSIVCKSFRKIKNKKSSKNTKNIDRTGKNLMCINCSKVKFDVYDPEIKCIGVKNPRPITTKKKAKIEKIEIPEWCPKNK
ncbi:MAG: hypothetical protein ACOCV1_04275 [Bacillota bacterium]